MFRSCKLHVQDCIAVYFKGNNLMENYKQYKSPLPASNSVVITTKFIWISTKVSDVHYLRITIYLPVKFQMCSFNTFRIIAGSRFPDDRMDERRVNLVPLDETGRGLTINSYQL